jgi:hypothetical protein
MEAGVPFIKSAGAPALLGPGSVESAVPFVFSLDWRDCLGEPEASDARDVGCDCDNRRAGEVGLSAAFSLCLPLPKKEEPRFVEEVFLSGEPDLLYGIVLCRRRPSTVLNLFKPWSPPDFCSGT